MRQVEEDRGLVTAQRLCVWVEQTSGGFLCTPNPLIGLLGPETVITRLRVLTYAKLTERSVLHFPGAHE